MKDYLLSPLTLEAGFRARPGSAGGPVPSNILELRAAAALVATMTFQTFSAAAGDDESLPAIDLHLESPISNAFWIF